MFTKSKVVSGGRYVVTRKVIDWQAIGGLAVIVLIVLALFS